MSRLNLNRTDMYKAFVIFFHEETNSKKIVQLFIASIKKNPKSQNNLQDEINANKEIGVVYQNLSNNLYNVQRHLATISDNAQSFEWLSERVEIKHEGSRYDVYLAIKNFINSEMINELGKARKKINAMIKFQESQGDLVKRQAYMKVLEELDKLENNLKEALLCIGEITRYLTGNVDRYAESILTENVIIPDV